MVKQARQSEPSGGVYVVVGDDPYLVGRQVERLLDGWLAPDERALCLHQPDPDKVGVAEVLDELRTLPFLAPRRVVVLRDADAFVSAHRQALERYLEEPSATGVLLLVVKSWPKSTRLAKKLAGSDCVIEAGAVAPAKLAGWAAGCARQEHDKTLAREAAELLVEWTGDDPGRVAREVEKLAVYVGSRRTITADDVEALVGHNRVFGAFDVIGAMTAGQRTEAIGRLRRLFEADRSAEYTVVGAFAYHFRRLFSARALLDAGQSPQQIAPRLKVWRRQEAFFQQARRLSLVQIGSVLAQLAHIDHGIKTGRTTAPVAMERLLMELIAVGS